MAGAQHGVLAVAGVLCGGGGGGGGTARSASEMRADDGCAMCGVQAATGALGEVLSDNGITRGRQKSGATRLQCSGRMFPWRWPELDIYSYT